MKKLLFALLMLVAVGCTKNIHEDPAEKLYFEIDIPQLEFPQSGGVEVIPIFTNGYWTVSTDPWLTLDIEKNEVKVGNYELRVRAGGNYGNVSSRSDNIVYNRVAFITFEYKESPESEVVRKFRVNVVQWGGNNDGGGIDFE